MHSSSTTSIARYPEVFDGHGDQGKRMSHFAKQARGLASGRIRQKALVPVSIDSSPASKALSKSLFSNTDLHTEPVAAIQACAIFQLGFHCLQDVGCTDLSRSKSSQGRVPRHPGAAFGARVAPDPRG